MTTTMTTIAEMRDAADPLLDSWLADQVHLVGARLADLVRGAS